MVPDDHYNTVCRSYTFPMYINRAVHKENLEGRAELHLSGLYIFELNVCWIILCRIDVLVGVKGNT